MRGGRADHAEVLGDLGAHIGAVVRIAGRVPAVVVPLVGADSGAPLDVGGQAPRHEAAVHAVVLDDVGHVVADQGGIPLGPRDSRFPVADPDRRARHDAVARHVASRRAAGLPRLRAHPPAEAGVRELRDQAVADAAGGRERPRPVGRDPHGHLVAAGPVEAHRCRHPGVADFLAPHHRLHRAAECLEAGHRRRALADHPHGAVAAARAHVEAPVRLHRHGGEQAARDRPVADHGVGHAGTETEPLGVLDGDRHLRIEVAPQHVAVEEPGVVEAGGLGLPAEGDDAPPVDVAAEGDGEFHGPNALPARRGFPRV